MYVCIYIYVYPPFDIELQSVRGEVLLGESGVFLQLPGPNRSWRDGEREERPGGGG